MKSYAKFFVLIGVTLTILVKGQNAENQKIKQFYVKISTERNTSEITCIVQGNISKDDVLELRYDRKYEKEQLKNVSYENHNNISYKTNSILKPGIYKCILQYKDVATFVIYDDIKKLNVDGTIIFHAKVDENISTLKYHSEYIRKGSNHKEGSLVTPDVECRNDKDETLIEWLYEIKDLFKEDKGVTLKGLEQHYSCKSKISKHSVKFSFSDSYFYSRKWISVFAVYVQSEKELRVVCIPDVTKFGNSSLYINNKLPGHSSGVKRHIDIKTNTTIGEYKCVMPDQYGMHEITLKIENPSFVKYKPGIRRTSRANGLALYARFDRFDWPSLSMFNSDKLVSCMHEDESFPNIGNSKELRIPYIYGNFSCQTNNEEEDIKFSIVEKLTYK